MLQQTPHTPAAVTQHPPTRAHMSRLCVSLSLLILTVSAVAAPQQLSERVAVPSGTAVFAYDTENDAWLVADARGAIGHGEDGLRLTVEAADSTVVAGLPIQLTAMLSPADGSVLENVPEISPGAGNVLVFIDDLATGSRRRYLGPLWGIDERAPDRRTVTHTAPMRIVIPLLFHNVIAGRDDLAAAALPLRPGRYRITAEYRGLGFPVTGGVDVNVRNPATDGEWAYWRAMQATPALAASIQIGNFARHEEVMPIAEALLREFPGAVYAGVTAFAVGSHYLHVANKPDKAEAILMDAATKPGNAVVRARIALELASAQIAQQHFEDAAATIERALTTSQETGVSAELRNLRALIQRPGR